MAKVVPAIDDELAEWISRQHVFFVASAPSGDGGHVNLSPKGYDTFAVLGPTEVAYLDLTGSGAETIAHVRQNGRLTIMFCAFEGPPQILRLFGAAEVVERDDPRWDVLTERWGPRPGARAVIRLDVDRVQTSCGYAVPFLGYEGERERLDTWAASRSDEEMADYRSRKNARSIDGLPAVGATTPEASP